MDAFANTNEKREGDGMRLIDADWLLDVVENIVKWDTERDRNRIIHQVRELTPIVNQWIPCSLRLPERSVEVLTYTEMVGLTEIQSLEQDKNGFMYWENQHGDIQDMTVTAWMPLPEPYRR